MSGIAGTFHADDRIPLEQIMAPIVHRGTSRMTSWNNHHATLAGIGITELGENPGPVVSADEDCALVWDGRLHPHHTRTAPSSQTETLLRDYQKLGVDLFPKIEGDFALAVIDGNVALLARDRLGIRPLYYGFSGEALLFASEMKALAPWVARVHELPPGCYLHSEKGIFPYPLRAQDEIQPTNPETSSSHLGDVLEKAVANCLYRDVETGVWLSGGVDSSVIAALAVDLGVSLQTFSAGLDGAPDLEYAALVADHLGCTHHERKYNQQEAIDVLEEVIFHLESFDAPLVRSAVGNFLVAELASDFVPYVLSGEGGDELLAGYAYQRDLNNDIELTLSVQEALSSLHNTALQRVDRSASAHQTRAELPFLQADLIAAALAIPSRWKIFGPEPIEKWPLRHALADKLPDKVIWRKKAKFWEGAGAKTLISDYADQQISDEEFQQERIPAAGEPLQTKEGVLYYQIFRGLFGEGVAEDNVGRTRHI
ncbi:MAG: hypothetical protein JXA97_12970 [Anaerolineales bacterium]|nr:hypothetical protein [Anaerolineales bacterium]